MLGISKILDRSSNQPIVNMIMDSIKNASKVEEQVKSFSESKNLVDAIIKLSKHFNLPENPSIQGRLQDLQKIDPKKVLDVLQTNNEVYDSADHFVGFDERHCAFTGDTGSGKTTAFNLLLCKGQFNVPPHVFVFISSMTKDGENGFYQTTSQFLTYDCMKRHGVAPKIYVYTESAQEMEKMLQAIKSMDVSTKKLCIIEDVRVAGENVMKKYVQPFLMGAKNASCQVVFMDHNPSQDVLTYQSCGYVVMCNPPLQTFNLITQGSRATKVTDPRWMKLSTLEKKAVIFDKFSDKKLYWVYSNMPLIQSY